MSTVTVTVIDEAVRLSMRMPLESQPSDPLSGVPTNVMPGAPYQGLGLGRGLPG
jgi:hypothetical protein